MIPIRLLAVLVFALAVTTASHAPAQPANSETDQIDASDARLELARVLRNDSLFAEAEAEYRIILESAPDRSDVRVELAEVLMWQKRMDDARGVLESVPEADLGSAGFKVMGDLAVQQDQFAEAEKWFDQALAESPDDPKIRFALAEALAWQKKYDASAGHLKMLVESTPTDVQLRRRYAQVLGWSGRNKEAASQWRLSLESTAE